MYIKSQLSLYSKDLGLVLVQLYKSETQICLLASLSHRWLVGSVLVRP